MHLFLCSVAPTAPAVQPAVPLAVYRKEHSWRRLPRVPANATSKFGTRVKRSYRNCILASGVQRATQKAAQLDSSASASLALRSHVATAIPSDCSEN